MKNNQLFEVGHAGVNDLTINTDNRRMYNYTANYSQPAFYGEHTMANCHGITNCSVPVQPLCNTLETNPLGYSSCHHIPAPMDNYYRWRQTPTYFYPYPVHPLPCNDINISTYCGHGINNQPVVLPPLNLPASDNPEYFQSNIQSPNVMSRNSLPSSGETSCHLCKERSPQGARTTADFYKASSPNEGLNSPVKDSSGYSTFGSLQSSSSPNATVNAKVGYASEGYESRILSVKERYPDLWKYGGLDGRFTLHRKDHIDMETLKSHFHLPMVEASKRLGVCVTVLKKICRRFGIARWPHRKLRSVAKHIEKHEKSFHKGYSDYLSYEEVLELCRKDPEKFSNSSTRSHYPKDQEVVSSSSSKASIPSSDKSLCNVTSLSKQSLTDEPVQGQQKSK
eukprot:jgi/Galph1/2939/GphlegSOOS_G1618.1